MDSSNDIPSNEPFEVVVGDTWKWKRSFTHYPASASWVLTYTLINSAGKISITAAADGDDHLVSISAATTAGYTKGDYTWQAWATKSGDRHLVDSGKITLLPDYASEATLDDRSFAKFCLDAIEAVIKGRATKSQLAASVDGESLQYMTPEDLFNARDRVRKEVAEEDRAERATNGLSHSGKIRCQF